MSTGTLVFFTFINILNYLDRYILAACLPSVAADLSLSHAQSGMLLSAFVPGYIIFAPVFGYLGDRYPRPRLMAIGVAIWSLATLVTAFAPDFTTLAAARVLVGIGEASFGTIAPGYFKDRIQDPVKVNSAMALFFSAIPVGSALGYVTGGSVAAHFSWQAAFLAGGLPGLMLAWFLLSSHEAPVRRLAADSLWRGLHAIASVRLLWYAIGGYVFNAFALNGVAGFVTTYGAQLGFSLDEISRWFGAILVAAGFAGTLGGGRLASRLAARGGNSIRSLFLFTGISSLLAVPFLYAAFSVQDRSVFLLLCFVAEVLIFSGTAPVNALIVSICPAALVTLTQGVTILAINAAGALPAPLIVGRLADVSSLRDALQLLAVAIMFSGLIWTSGALRSSYVQKRDD